MTIVTDAPVGFPVDVPLERELDTMGIRYRRILELPLEQVRIEPKAQVRTSHHQAPPIKVTRYAVQMKAGAMFPPIVVAEDATSVAEYDLVDGNTRLKAARDKEVQRDTFPAYVLQGASYVQCHEIGVYLNQRNGEDLDKKEVTEWIHEALAQGVPLSRIARISGFAYQTVKKLDGQREFQNRAEKLRLSTRTIESLPGPTQAVLAQKVQHDAVFEKAAQLAADAAISASDMRPIVALINKTGSDQEAFEILEKERASRLAQITELQHSQRSNGAVVKPPYYTQMRKHLQFLLARGPLDLFDPSLASQADSEQLLRDTVARLNEALAIYAERKHGQAA